MAERTVLDEKGRAALRARLVDGLADTELPIVCHDLGLRYADLPGATFSERVIALVEHPQVRRDFAPLFDWLRRNERGYLLDDLPTLHSSTTTPTTYSPATHSSIWNITHLRNPNFMGRKDLLADLRRALTTDGTALPQAIVGLGGIGKTQTAVEYAYRYQDDYAVIWWVDAEVAATIPNQFAQLAERLELVEARTQQQRLAVDAALRWLGEHDGWLLTLDNVERPEDVKRYLPRPLRGHVLMTSRYRAWGGLARVVEAPPLTEDEAAAMLLRRTGQVDEASAQALARELGGLPLAIEQAAAYIDRRRLPLAQYLALYGKYHLALLEKEKPSQDYPATVATTWALAFEHVETAMPAAADLLRLCAFFAPDHIPLDAIVTWAEHLPERLAACVTDELDLPDALGLLGDYSLVEVQADGGRRTEDGGQAATPPLTTDHQPLTTVLSLHRLVQAVTRARLDADATRTWASAAVRVVNAAVPEDTDDYRNWPLCERLLPHGFQATEAAEALGVAWAETATLLSQGGLYLWSRAQYRAAQAAIERALRLREAHLGPDHPDVAESCNNLALVLYELGDLPLARAHYERALGIEEAIRGPDHPVIAIILNNLVDVLRAQGELSTARAFQERSLHITEAAFGPDHPNTAKRLGRLGTILRELGELAAARVHLERSLRISEITLGSDHPDVASRLHSLGLVFQAQGDLPRARARLERALSIREDKLGPDHPEVAYTLTHLGAVLYDQGDGAAARVQYERAVRIFETVLGRDHRDTQQARRRLESLTEDEGRKTEE
ncbi:MAG: tetratricopeptide repeat protein [Anaerolineae bacterium]|nr:tetratricopeptide repeat protein [Anaerolineae bacterium]